MILSDRDLRQRLHERSIVVEPLADLELQLQPASIDLRLGGQFRRAVKGCDEVEEVFEGDDFVLGPGENLGPTPASLRVGSRICQIVFHVLTSPVERPYGPARGSKYFGQSGPTTSRMENPTQGTQGAES